ncbi:TonB-dependent receptor [Pseudoalteromonas tunicata]|uniref:TonB-dependent receptor n=1 Tax=Pseudoalteromonas tunicata TaxID=314281 RepID=UPI0027400ABC|nr:TonB-dependent receptor [Pseudoalteromonas tunicata]MDP5213373.1 TonB-dependent receptor [Pseudoalteromonas tunicata]
MPFSHLPVSASRNSAWPKSKITKSVFAILSSSALLSASHLATADEVEVEQVDLERILITSEKRTANIMEVASSVSALFGQELVDSEVNTITELSHLVPSLHVFSWGGRRDSNVFMRGIGPGLFTEPTVGFYVDGVNYGNNSIFDLELVDIERAEVLRGPQGTLYGGNSLSGVINIVTKKPDEVPEFKGVFSYDEFSAKRLKLAINTPLNQDNLFLSVSGSAHHSDGHLKNTYLNTHFGAHNDISARTKLRWLATDDIEVNFVVDYERFRGDSYAMGILDQIKENPDEVQHDFEGIDNRDALGLSITIDFTGKHIDFISITSWRDWENDNSADQDTGHTPGYVFTSSSLEDFEQFSQEFRWSSKGNHPINWLTGLYAYQSETTSHAHNFQDFSAVGMGGPTSDYSVTTKEDESLAAFGQLDYKFTDQLTLTSGVRFHNEKRYAQLDLDFYSRGMIVEYDGKKSFNEILPKFAISYQTLESDLIYSSYSKGYRAGGFDTLYPNQNKPTFEPEYSHNYELGYKTLLLDNKLSLSLAAFYIQLKEQQVQQLLQNATIITDNAGKSESKGIELESRFNLNTNWSLSFSTSYIAAQYKAYKSINFATFMAEDYSDNYLPNTPKLSANLSINHRQELDDNLSLMMQVDNIFMGEHYFDAANTMKQPDYYLLNAKVGIEAQDWYAHLWIKNALDEYYSKVAFNFGFGVTAEAGNPRTIGITVGTSF